MRFMLLLCWLITTPAFALEKTFYPFASPQDAARFDTLTHAIRCVVCQNQSIADSNAPLAEDLRAKVYTFIQEKKSDEVIYRYLVKRYGDFILLKPPFQARTWLLWLFPFLALIMMGTIICCLLYQHQKSPPPPKGETMR